MRLDDELLEFLRQPLMCIIAAVDGEGRPAPGRGIGVQVTEDRESIDVIFSGWQWPRIEPCIRKTGWLTATFVRPSDYVTYQIKGPAAMRDTKVQDLEGAERFMADATGALTSLGVPPTIILPWLTARDAKVAHLVASEIYIQTPGPHAGMSAGVRSK